MQSEQSYLAARHTVSGNWTYVVYLFKVSAPDDPPPEDLARADYVVEYNTLKDQIGLNVGGERTLVKFGVLRTTFSWRGHEHEIRLFLGGKIDVRRGKVVVMDGEFAEDGVILGAHSPEMEPLVTPLSVALNVRRKHRQRAAVASP